MSAPAVCTCGAALSTPRSKRCRPCALAHLNRDPTIKARRTAGIKKYAADNPEKVRATAAKQTAAKRKNTAYMDYLARRMREIQPLSLTPEALARRDNVQRGLSLSDTRLPWCPREYRDLYRYWINGRHKNAIEARALVEAQMKADRRPSTFEEKLQAVAEGRMTISANPRLPVRQYDRTLGGVGW